MPLSSRLVAVAAAGALLAGVVSVPAAAAPAPGDTPLAASPWRAPKPDKTSKAEAKRVDRVKVKPGWYGCFDYAQCATVRVPLDYDQPKGATTEIAVVRIKARKPKSKIGSLFLNPGGPGGSGTGIAMAAPFFLGDAILDRFDIVGFDPRGIAYSDNVKCFKTAGDQLAAIKGLDVAFPFTKAEEKAYIKSAKALGKGCSTTGKKLAGAMSTAEVARDMDVLRRAVGDKKLNFLGFSYGSAVGGYYANMFPDRVRSIVIDGVINPKSWTGSKSTQNQILDDRLRSADGAYKALREILVRCGKAGTEACEFAGGDPVQKFEAVAARLRQAPIVVPDPEFGDVTVTYASFIGNALGALYSPLAYTVIISTATQLHTLITPTAGAAERAAAAKSLASRIRAAREAPGRDFPYANGLEAFLGVTCTDGLHPKDASLWPSLVAKSDKRAPYFGRAWGWSTAPCANKTWTVKDEDAYRGPFTKRTSSPVLVVGNYWDPATNYNDAVSTAKLLPNSRLLSSDSWGHTAYGTSACATNAVDQYLLKLTLPAKGTVCVGDVQPFAGGEGPGAFGANARLVRPNLTKAEWAAKGLPKPGAPKVLPPITVRIPTTTG
jgi:pimeloyl-ACP methyl ester carboxylesterase